MTAAARKPGRGKYRVKRDDVASVVERFPSIPLGDIYQGFAVEYGTRPDKVRQQVNNAVLMLVAAGRVQAIEDPRTPGRLDAVRLFPKPDTVTPE